MPLDLRALETSFDLVAPRGDELMDSFFARLVPCRSGRQHAIVPKLRELGARHVAYGAEPDHHHPHPTA